MQVVYIAFLCDSAVNELSCKVPSINSAIHVVAQQPTNILLYADTSTYICRHPSK